MYRIANPSRSVRLRPAPPLFFCSVEYIALKEHASMVKLVDTADLKSAAFVHSGRAGSIPARGTKS